MPLTFAMFDSVYILVHIDAVWKFFDEVQVLMYLQKKSFEDYLEILLLEGSSYLSYCLEDC